MNRPVIWVTRLCRQAQACLRAAISMPHQGDLNDLQLYWLRKVILPLSCGPGALGSGHSWPVTDAAVAGLSAGMGCIRQINQGAGGGTD